MKYSIQWDGFYLTKGLFLNGSFFVRLIRYRDGTWTLFLGPVSIRNW